MALPNPSFEPETHRWSPAAGAPSREVPSQIRAVLGQKEAFFAQNSPQTQTKRPNKRKQLLHSTCALIAPSQRAFCCPLTPLYVRETAQKWLKLAPMCAIRAKQAQNQVRDVSWARWLKTEFRGHLVHPQPPLLVVSKPRNHPMRRLDPCTSAHLVEPEGSSARAQWGPTVGPKNHFFQSCFRPLGMPKQVFLARFEPVVARFGPWKIPKCLENGSFRDQKWVKNGSKTRCSKSDPGPFGMLKQVFLAHFEPNLIQFSPLCHMYALLFARTLEPYGGATDSRGEGCR